MVVGDHQHTPCKKPVMHCTRGWVALGPLWMGPVSLTSNWDSNSRLSSQ